MNPTVGTTDRIIGSLVSVGLLSLLVVPGGPARWFGLVGLVPLLAASGICFCRLFIRLGVRTCKV